MKIISIFAKVAATAMMTRRFIEEGRGLTDPGYTYHGKLNHQLDSASGQRRLDYVLAFDTVTVPNRAEPVALRPLQLHAASVVRPNHSGRHLSDHFGVELDLILR